MIFRVCRKGWSQQEPAEVFHSMQKIDMHITYMEIKGQCMCVAQMHFPKAKALPSLLLHGTHTAACPSHQLGDSRAPWKGCCPSSIPPHLALFNRKEKKITHIISPGFLPASAVPHPAGMQQQGLLRSYKRI